MITTDQARRDLQKKIQQNAPNVPPLPHIPAKSARLSSIAEDSSIAEEDLLTAEQQEENLLYVALYIVECRPEDLDMSDWHSYDGQGIYPSIEEACGTTHCIAGFAQIMAGVEWFTDAPDLAGILLLGAEAKRYFMVRDEEGLAFLKEVIARNG